jgi:hypothetical protein
MSRPRWLAAAVTAVLLCALAAPLASAPARTTPAARATKKKKKRAVACKPGQARLRIGKRTICISHSLPTTRTSPQATLAATAVHLAIGSTRDRRGRRSKSLSQLLGRVGPHARADLEKAVAVGIAKGEQLAHGARVAVHPTGAASEAGCGASTPGLPGASSSKVGEATVDLGIENGALKLGIDVKGKGIGVTVNLRSCGDGSIQLGSCPTADGKVEGHGHSELEASFKVTEGATVVMAQAFKFGGETTVKAQTGDDGKLDYYDIKHVYSLVGSFGGSKAAFGPITVDTTYIGEARIDMRSGSTTPPPASVDVMLTMAGVDPAERIAAEIKVAREAQSQADKEFAAEVEKATKQLRAQEEFWLTPNKCASLHFEPISESLKLRKGQTGTVKSRTEASAGGAPPAASWTLGAQQNATFTPGGSEGNPLTTSYSVTNAGKGLVVSATFRATSKAGVAEDTWKQKTESVIASVTGSFSGRDERGGELLEWSGTITFARIPESPDGTSILEPVASEVSARVSGTAPEGCTVAGEEHVAVFEKSPFSVLGESTPGVGYDIDVPFGFPGRLNAAFSNCPPKGEGFSGSVSLPGEAVLTGDVFSGGPSALIKTSPDGVTFAGSASAEEPEEDLSWSWSFTGST